MCDKKKIDMAEIEWKFHSDDDSVVDEDFF